MKRKKLYLIAGIFSLFFYFLGIMSGLFVEQSLTQFTESEVNRLQRRMQNLQLEYAYLSIVGKDLSCSSLASLTRETTRKVRELGKKLEEENPDSKDLRREYAFLSTKAWILNSHLKEKCKGKVVVLYFYSVPCQNCIKQGNILDKVREEKFKQELSVFVLNSDLDEPIVNTLKTAYSIKKTPSLVIGDQTYSGLVKEENLTEIISKELK